MEETLNRGVPTASGGASTIFCRTDNPLSTHQEGPFAVASLPVAALAAPSVQDASNKEMRGASHGDLAWDWVDTDCCAVVEWVMGTNSCFAAKIPTPNAPGLFLEFQVKLTRLQ